ncbi:hypothetical protein Lal_00043409 [Lupinus albus]|nr:hypothetical protein Lal_00043409 [Lupinus albus]
MFNQTEMFCETRQNKKGESLDQETTNAMAQLQDLIENCTEQLMKIFKQNHLEDNLPHAVQMGMN